MSRNLRTFTVRLLAAPLVGLFVTALLIGCGQKEEGPVNASSSNYEVDDDTPSDQETEVVSPAATDTGGGGAGGIPTPPAMPPMGAEAVDPLQVPDGEAELLAFLESLQTYQPQRQPTSQQEFMAELIKVSQAQVTAADKLLATTKNEEMRLTATQAKLDAMRMMGRVNPDPRIAEELSGYCRTVMADENKDIALLGRLLMLGLATDGLMSGQATDGLMSGQATDAQPVLAELKQLITDSPNAAGVFQVVSGAAQAIQRTGDEQATTEAFDAIVATYKTSDDPEIASQARALELNTKLPALLAGEPGSVDAVMANLKELLGGDLLNETVLTMTSQVGQILEMSGNYQEAGETFVLIENAFKNNADPRLAEQAALRTANGSKRAGLVGKPFEVEGVNLDGSPFDWSQYAGKVVLVDFWATWCGPCLQEIPNIVSAYEKYKDKGFEVVGVNLDDNVQTVQQFLGPQPLPWVTVVGPDPTTRGFNNPMAAKCGVDAIPFLVLVNQEGNAIALHVRGEKLEEKLAELLGPVADPVSPAPGVQPAPSVDALPAAPTVPAVPIVPAEPAAPAGADAPSAPPQTLRD